MENVVGVVPGLPSFFIGPAPCMQASKQEHVDLTMVSLLLSHILGRWFFFPAYRLLLKMCRQSCSFSHQSCRVILLCGHDHVQVNVFGCIWNRWLVGLKLARDETEAIVGLLTLWVGFALMSCCCYMVCDYYVEKPCIISSYQVLSGRRNCCLDALDWITGGIVLWVVNTWVVES